MDSFTELVVRAASDVLTRTVGPSDNFFLAGGDSLKAARLAALIEAWAGGIKVELDDVFEAPQLAALAARILQRNADAGQADPGKAAPRTEEPAGGTEARPQDGEVPLTYGQRRRLQRDASTPAGRGPHHVFDIFDVSGPLNVEALRGACIDVTARHPALRTLFTVRGDKFVARRARIAEFTDPGILRVVRKEDPRSADAWALIEASTQELFDLAGDVKLRVLCVTNGAEIHRVAVTVEHLVCDGQSLSILLRDLSAAYASRCDDPLANWQGDHPVDTAWSVHEQEACTEQLAERLDYWRSNLDPLEVNPEIRLPGMHDPVTAEIRAAWDKLPIPADVLQALRRRCAQESSSVYCGFLAAMALSVCAHTGRNIVGVTSPTSIRPPGWESHVDWIASSAIYRFRVETGSSTGAVIQAARAAVIGGLRNTLPMALLLGTLLPSREDLQRWQPYLFLDVAERAETCDLDLAPAQVSAMSTDIRPAVRRGVTIVHVELNSHGGSVFMQYEQGTWSEGNARTFLESLVDSAKLLADEQPVDRAVAALRARHQFTWAAQA